MTARIHPFILALVVCLLPAGGSRAQENSGVSRETKPPSGFAEAPEQVLNPRNPGYIAPPDNFILDPGNLLDPPRRVKLSQHLQAEADRTGVRVFVAAYPAMRDEAPSTRAVRLQSGWIQTGHGGVLVYGGDTRRFGVAVSRTTLEILPTGTLQSLLERCERNLRNSKNVALTLREGAMDLMYELTAAVEENRLKRERMAPLRLAGVAVAAAALLVAVAWLFRQLRVQNTFGRSHRLLRRPDGTPRYGGLRSGGRCAVVRFGDPGAGNS